MDTVTLSYMIILIVLAAVGLFAYHLGQSRAAERPGEDARQAPADVAGETVWAVRKPAVSGSFYPQDPEKLSGMIREYLDAVNVFEANRPLGLISPHAGYVYSGPTAAYGYRQLEGRDYETVIVLAASHRVGFEGVSIANVSHYETPLGLIPLSPKAVGLRESGVAGFNAKAHVGEHSLEVQLPFLQEVLGSFHLVPIITGDVNPQWLAERLIPLIDDMTLVVASTDLSHYESYEKALELDGKCVNDITGMDSKAVAGDKLCGKAPVLALMEVARRKGWSNTELDYRNSGDTAGSRDRVVGYTSIAFHDGLNGNEEEYLLKLARNTLQTYLSTGETPKVDEDELTPRLKEVRGCFVTYNKNHELRGCIGHILPSEPLYKCVIQNAVSAAVRDGRFPPVTAGEAGEIEIEVSVLTQPQELDFTGPEDLLGKLVPLRDGVIVENGYRSATYLPQVWGQIPGKQDFLSNLCRKSGSSRGCWRESGVRVSTYQAQVFSE